MVDNTPYKIDFQEVPTKPSHYMYMMPLARQGAKEILARHILPT